MNAGNNFEAQLSALEKIVRDLENGELPLEESLKLFEQGIGLYRQCQERLNQAERRIEVLLRDSDGKPIVESLTDKNLSKAEVEPEPKVKRRYVFSDDDDEQDESVF
jgi:exodeoxyribonuclease VII small subunit